MERIVPGAVSSMEVRIHPADETALRGRKGASWKRIAAQVSEFGMQASLVLDKSCPRQQIEWRVANQSPQILTFCDLIRD
jgi:hypothetical protein